MQTKRRLFTGMGLGLLALALALSVAFGWLGSAPAYAQTATPAPTTPNTQQPANPPAPGAARPDFSQLAQAFTKAFAARLGIDEAKLNAAYTAAIGDVADQAVKDGQLTQDQANRLKDAAKNGIQGHGFMGGLKGGPHGGIMGGPHGGMMGGSRGFGGPTLDEAARALGITTDELRAQLQAGKSIATVAADRKVELQKVKDALLAGIKTRLDDAVKNNRITQAQADQAYQMAGTHVDNFVNNTGMRGPGGRGHGGR